MKDITTELRIKETAKRIFFSDGRFNAKMHEIAEEADINRALLHYYFRDRENLFDVVMQEAMDSSFVQMFRILSQELQFEQKIEEAVHHIVDCLTEFPFMETFIISELNKDPEKGKQLSAVKDGKKFMKGFLKEISAYIKKHKLPYSGPGHFMVNMMSLCAYPATTKPIVKNILGLSEPAYRKFMGDRKKTLTKLILMK
jgi:TetR/AcrR family transcriptional regulator